MVLRAGWRAAVAHAEVSPRGLLSYLSADGECRVVTPASWL
jgi:hypothetical protein